MPSERDIDNYINEIEEKNQIYMEEELEYAEKCHNLEEQLGCPLDVLAKILFLDRQRVVILHILRFHRLIPPKVF